jgi:hypothetical protein
MKPHPDTGLLYLHVYENGPIYDEVKAAWSHVPSTETMGADQWRGCRDRYLQDPGCAVTFWGNAPEIPLDHRCLIAHYYTEAVPLEPGVILIPEQRRMLDRFLSYAANGDLVFAHSPTAAEGLKRFGLAPPVVLLPSGFDPRGFGRPDWKVPKVHEVLWFGFMTPRRASALAILDRTLRGRIVGTILWGTERRTVLNRAKGNLVLLHATGVSYPTIRIWSGLGASAALITEPGDTWPARAGHHYVEIPTFDETDQWGERCTAVLAPLLDHPALLLDIARRAHGELSGWTPSHIAREFLIPGFEMARFHPVRARF